MVLFSIGNINVNGNVIVTVVFGLNFVIVIVRVVNVGIVFLGIKIIVVMLVFNVVGLGDV